MKRMHRYLVVLAAALLAIPMAGSTPVDASRNRPPTPLLWKVSDRDNAVYLLGSFHLLKKSDYPLSRDVEDAFAQSESITFEIAPDDLNDPSISSRMVQLASSEPASSIGRLLPTAVLAALDKRMTAVGLPAEQMHGFEPWFVDATLVTLLGQSAGYASDQGLDRYLMARAAQSRKKVGGLETVEMQLTALDGTPVSEQVASLRELVDEGSDAAAHLEQLHRAWRDADIPTLERLTREEMRDLTPVTYRMLNVDRNRAWLPQLDAMLARGKGHDAMVVVGALHLLGGDGVVEQMRKRGYRVERICSACMPAALTRH